MRSAMVLGVVFLAGCVSGGVTYAPPSQSTTLTNSKVIDRPRDQVWAAAVPALGKQFYVINNVDKSSGLINLSFNGNPAKFIDCGTVTTKIDFPGVNEATSSRSFAGSSPEEVYETAVPIPPYGIAGRALNRRTMALDGRVNLIFEELTPNSTRVTANVRYSITRQITIQVVGQPYPAQSRSDTIGFNSSGSESFPPSAAVSGATRCVPTGALESDILSLVN